MRWTFTFAFVVSLMLASPAAAQVIFVDDFEWGSICAWSNDLWYPDLDGDTFGDSSEPGVPSDCPAPIGTVSNNLDCDDGDEHVHIGAAEICDGLDNDCDPLTVDGLDDSQVGLPCDGPDSDLCEEGTHSCTGGSLVCSDTTGNTLDLCNGTNDDCDPASADGSEDPQVGAACDGPDSDLCDEGTNSCTGGSLVCSDTTGNTLDLCNGTDDDCDPASADGSEDPLLGAACDGSDSDLCEEGTQSCTGGSLVCSDTTGNTLDLCDGTDDDCDPASADGSEDPQVGAACDGPDLDLCEEGTFNCSGGVLLCSDMTGNTPELCDGQDNDCDGLTDEDWSCSIAPDSCCPAFCTPLNDADC